MRGEGEAVPVGVGLHQGEVVLDRLGGEGEDGGGEAAVEEVAALGGQLPDGEPFGVRRERLEAVIDPFVRESLESLREPLAGHEASSKFLLHSLQHSLRISRTAV